MSSIELPCTRAAEDYVIERRKKGAKWTWSSLRPGTYLPALQSCNDENFSSLTCLFNLWILHAKFDLRMGPDVSHLACITGGCLHAGCIVGYSLGFMNLLQNIAVYGTLCKELGYAFRCTLYTLQPLLLCHDVPAPAHQPTL